MLQGKVSDRDKGDDVLISSPWGLSQELDISTKGGIVDPLTPASGLPSNFYSNFCFI
jgi:hypothetical protein